MKTELKPCPFCGGEAEEMSQITSLLLDPRNFWFFRCKLCGSSGAPAWHPKQAAENWNRRAEDGN